jgi:hypothetical protein
VSFATKTARPIVVLPRAGHPAGNLITRRQKKFLSREEKFANVPVLKDGFHLFAIMQFGFAKIPSSKVDTPLQCLL